MKEKGKLTEVADEEELMGARGPILVTHTTSDAMEAKALVRRRKLTKRTL